MFVAPSRLLVFLAFYLVSSFLPLLALVHIRFVWCHLGRLLVFRISCRGVFVSLLHFTCELDLAPSTVSLLAPFVFSCCLWFQPFSVLHCSASFAVALPLKVFALSMWFVSLSLS